MATKSEMENNFYQQRQLSKDLQDQAHVLCELKNLRKDKLRLIAKERRLLNKLCEITDRATVREMNSKRGERR